MCLRSFKKGEQSQAALRGSVLDVLLRRLHDVALNLGTCFWLNARCRRLRRSWFANDLDRSFVREVHGVIRPSSFELLLAICTREAKSRLLPHVDFELARLVLHLH